MTAARLLHDATVLVAVVLAIALVVILGALT